MFETVQHSEDARLDCAQLGGAQTLLLFLGPDDR